jgi:sugar transferase (PEP-CTERM/EpsH1 system associated)
MTRPDPRPLICHVVHRFDVGGLENGVVNLVNRLPLSAWRHEIVALTEVAEAFRRRVVREDVGCTALGKGPGHLWRLYPMLHRHFRATRPSIVHTRNLGALEACVPAWSAGVPVRLHGEHGRDARDPRGDSRRLQRVRRLYRPFVSRYVAVSQDLERYLVERVGLAPARVERIINGVDCERFRPRAAHDQWPDGCPFERSRDWLVGTVGRMDPVKDQLTLVQAFIAAVRSGRATRMRLVLVGDGALRPAAERLADAAGVRPLVWFAGERADVPQLLRSLDCFVLPSRGEGISNTILEAMASGLPVIATRVGGNNELVADGVTGALVAAGDPERMAEAILHYYADPSVLARHGSAGRRRAVEQFGLQVMVERYHALYARALTASGRTLPAAWPAATGVR